MPEASEALFPLDIPYAEISPWLANRRKLASDWIKRLRELQSRGVKAFGALPVAFATQFSLPEDGVVEYSTAKRIRDTLAETAERGYFGGLSGEAAVWDSIVKNYERSNLYLGEAGQRILQNVDYEIPFIKKRMEGLDKRVVELERRTSDCNQSATTAAAAFAKDCAELGVDGADLLTGFEALGNCIYSLLEAPFEALKSEKTKKAMEFYRAVSQELHQVGNDALGMLQSVFEDTIQPPPPEAIQEFHLATEATTQAAAREEVAAEINWDFDITLETPEETLPETEPFDDGGIDWDVEVEPMTAETVAEMGTSEAPAAVIGVADEVEASAVVLRFVWDVSFRHALLDDLYELQAFLKVQSLSVDRVTLTLTDILRGWDPQDTQEALQHIYSIIDAFTADATQRYLMLKTSRSYTERLLVEFQKKGSRQDEWHKQGLQAQSERAAVQTELSQAAIQLGQLTRQTRELKTLVEERISPLFDNRPINVMGKINAVI